MTPRIGFCCKYLHTSDTVGAAVCATDRTLNSGTTTVTWLNRQTTNCAEERLWQLMQHNIESVRLLVETVGAMPANRRMFRISSDLLPVYTEPRWSYFWRRTDVRDYCAREFARVGDAARAADVRLSFHPGQFCCLASDNPDIVRRSIEEFEYHVDMARWMGYGSSWHDQGFKINIHMSGRAGATGFVSALDQLSTEARNLITVENDEMAHGLDDVLAVSQHCAVVLDIHHHVIRTGEYIQATDPRAQQVIDSWRGVRPVLHYSQSREDLLVNHDVNVLPDIPKLLTEGYRKQKLRAHSDFLWNTAANHWALTFAEGWDIQVEAKSKNLASAQLANLLSS